MTQSIHFLNHTSLILEYEDHFLLLDPWPSDSLAFESWKPHPPCFLNEDILAAFINASNDNAGIIISHGHDDHCDDSFLKKVKSNTNVFYPNYRSKGSLRRLHNNGLENVIEVNQLEFVSFGPFSIATFIIEEHSEDDAVFVIKTDEYILVHANDNSVPFPKRLVDFITSESDCRKIYFASQTGIANGYPYCYPQFFTEDDKNVLQDIAIAKTTRTIQVAIDNANSVRAQSFISYAAYTISLPLLEKTNGRVSQFFPSPQNLHKLKLRWGDLKLLDFVPGDTLEILDDKVKRPFWLQKHGLEGIATELHSSRSRALVPVYERFESEISRLPAVNSEGLMDYLKQYMDGFAKYVSNLDAFWKDEILNKKLIFKIMDVGELCIDLNTGFFLHDYSNVDVNKKIIVGQDVALLLVAGVFNFESLYIGHHALFERFPREKYNHELMHQLQVYGYIYQKRMVPKELQF